MSGFRNWAHNLWLDNCEERMLYCGGDRLSEKEYFARFKWWLRRRWRYLQQEQLKREKTDERFKRWA